MSSKCLSDAMSIEKEYGEIKAGKLNVSKELLSMVIENVEKEGYTCTGKEVLSWKEIKPDEDKIYECMFIGDIFVRTNLDIKIKINGKCDNIQTITVAGTGRYKTYYVVFNSDGEVITSHIKTAYESSTEYTFLKDLIKNEFTSGCFTYESNKVKTNSTLKEDVVKTENSLDTGTYKSKNFTGTYRDIEDGRYRLIEIKHITGVGFMLIINNRTNELVDCIYGNIISLEEKDRQYKSMYILHDGNGYRSSGKILDLKEDEPRYMLTDYIEKYGTGCLFGISQIGYIGLRSRVTNYKHAFEFDEKTREFSEISVERFKQYMIRTI